MREDLEGEKKLTERKREMSNTSVSAFQKVLFEISVVPEI